MVLKLGKMGRTFQIMLVGKAPCFHSFDVAGLMGVLTQTLFIYSFYSLHIYLIKAKIAEQS